MLSAHEWSRHRGPYSVLNLGTKFSPTFALSRCFSYIKLRHVIIMWLKLDYMQFHPMRIDQQYAEKICICFVNYYKKTPHMISINQSYSIFIVHMSVAFQPPEDVKRQPQLQSSCWSSPLTSFWSTLRESHRRNCRIRIRRSRRSREVLRLVRP